MRQDACQGRMRRGKGLHVGVAEDDRLIGRVGAGHDERSAGAQQQYLQRRVGQEGADGGTAAADASRQASGLAGTPPDQDNRTGGRLEQPDFGRRRDSVPDEGFQVGVHDGKRLAVAVLDLAQGRDGGIRSRIAGQVVAANALDRHDLSAPDGFDGGLERSLAFCRCRCRGRSTGGGQTGISSCFAAGSRS